MQHNELEKYNELNTQVTWNVSVFIFQCKQVFVISAGTMNYIKITNLTHQLCEQYHFIFDLLLKLSDDGFHGNRNDC